MKRIHGVNVALRFIRSSRGLGCKTSGGRLLCTDRSGTEIFPNKQKCAGYIPEHCLPIYKKRKERIKFMRDLEKVCIHPKYNYCTREERFTFIKLPKCLGSTICPLSFIDALRSEMKTDITLNGIYKNEGMSCRHTLIRDYFRL